MRTEETALFECIWIHFDHLYTRWIFILRQKHHGSLPYHHCSKATKRLTIKMSKTFSCGKIYNVQVVMFNNDHHRLHIITIYLFIHQSKSTSPYLNLIFLNVHILNRNVILSYLSNFWLTFGFIFWATKLKFSLTSVQERWKPSFIIIEFVFLSVRTHPSLTS